MIRRTIDELKTLYRYEPNVRDVWVEGVKDVRIYGRVIKGLVKEDVAVRSIDFVEVTEASTRRIGLTDGNRSRAIALAVELDVNDKINAGNSYAVVVDRDLDELIGNRIESDSLIYTDGSSIECYLIKKDNLEKFADVCLGDIGHADASTIRSVIEASQGIAYIRAANEILKLGMALPNIDGSLCINNKKVALDINDLTERTLNKNGNSRIKSKFEEEVGRLSRIEGLDPLLFCRGHDIIYLYYKVLTFKKNRTGIYANEDGFASALFGCLEPAFLKEEPLLMSLVSRLGLSYK